MKTLKEKNIIGEYTSPEVRTIAVQSEGILCASVENEDYRYYEFEW